MEIKRIPTERAITGAAMDAGGIPTTATAGVHPHRRHGGAFRLSRFFEHGDLRLVALQLIAEKPRHGYEIINAIEEKSGGAYTPSAGAVYPTLTLLQELGHLTVTDGEDGRKLHTLTEEGGGISCRQSQDGRSCLRAYRASGR